MKTTTPTTWRPGWKTLLAVGLLTWLIVVLASFPAARAWAWWGTELPGLQVARVQGTLWQGSLQGVSYNNFSARSISWQLSPLALLRLRASVDLDIRLEDGFVTAHALAAPSGIVELSELQGQLSLPMLAPVLELPPDMVEGQLNFGFEEVLIDGMPRTARGRATLGQAGFRIGRRFTEVGNFAADIHTSEAQELVAEISDQGQGPLAVTGQASFNPDNRTYRSSLQLRPREADSELGRMLDGGLQQDQDGNYLLDFNGRLQLP